MASRNLNLLLKHCLKASSVPVTSTFLTPCRSFVARNVVRENETSQTLNPSEVRRKIMKLPFNDTSLGSLMTHLKSEKMRDKTDLIYFEGKRLLKDAMNAGIVPLKVYFSSRVSIADLNFPQSTEVYKIPYNELKIWSNLKTCPGILAICRKPGVKEDYEGELPVSVICDQVREPGNLGALIRSSAAAGVQDVFLTPGCADFWSPATLRGGMGAHFKIPILHDYSWGLLRESLSPNTLYVVATNQTLHGSPTVVPYFDINYTQYEHITIVIGGETEGISEEAVSAGKQFDFRRVTIPLSNEIESLNTVSALSVILFEVRRQFKALQGMN